MSKQDGTMRVKQVPGEFGIMLVESWTNPDQPHRVDLLAHGGHGSCSCTDWSTRCRANQKASPGEWVDYGTAKNPDPKRTVCRHGTVARKYFLREVLMGLAKQHRGTEDGT